MKDVNECFNEILRDINEMLLHLGKAEICHFDIATSIHQNILWLKVSIHETHVMQVLEGEQHLDSIEAGLLLIKLPHSWCIGEKL